MLFLTLDCGRQVSLDSFDYSRTYSGLLMGKPDAEMNTRILEQARTEREATWGRRAIHVIPPVVDTRDPKHPQLPSVMLRAWLTCYQSIDPNSDGSELVVVWFSNECHMDSIGDVVHRAIRGLAWDQLAAGFEW